MTVDSIVVPARFRGPPDSGNGGYVCGVFAALLTGDRHALPDHLAAEVTLRAPTPLERALAVRREAERLLIFDGDTLIAEARLAPLLLEVPPAPSYTAALAVQAASPSLIPNASHRIPDSIGFHPTCFCCGVQNPEGLQVMAAPLPGNRLVAAAWPTQDAWADESGHLPAAFVWGALDCPGQFAFYATGIRTGMLGRLAARIEHPIRAGSRCVVTGWCIGVDGAKHYAGTAVFDEDGRLCAYAKATWVGRRNPASGIGNRTHRTPSSSA